MTVSNENYPQLSRPPLREAIIDIRLRQDLPLTFMESLRTLTLPGFSNVGEIKVGGFKLEVAQGKPSQAVVTSDEILGIRFQSPENSQVIQFRRNGATFSVLKGYTTWESFQAATHDLWQQFLRISGAVVVSRLAVRYINAIDVPIGANFDDYLTAAPRIPEPLPQLYTSFLQRVVIPFVEAEAYAIVTEVLEQPKESSVPTIIDIDVANDCSLEGVAPEIWDTLSKLRNIKNRIFFASVTPRALEVYR